MKILLGFLTVVSILLIIVTFPFSIWGCIKMVQVPPTKHENKNKINFFLSKTIMVAEEVCVNCYISNPIKETCINPHIKYRHLKVGTNENGSACGRWLSIGI